MISTGWFFYGLTFLELWPQYSCYDEVTQTWNECLQKEFCGTNTVHKINYDSKFTLHNFVQKLDLTCTP
jgi:hypothetical protein